MRSTADDGGQGNQSAEISGQQANKEVADSIESFTVSIQKRQAEFIKLIQVKQEEQSQGESFIKELEQEIADLRKRGAELGPQWSKCGNCSYSNGSTRQDTQRRAGKTV